jgi:hypothetical protein
MTSSRRPRRTSGRQALGTEQLETRAMLSGDGFSTSVTADDVAVDALGNTYLVGSFRGTVDFDPGAAVMSLTSVGARDGEVRSLGCPAVGAGHFLLALGGCSGR